MISTHAGNGFGTMSAPDEITRRVIDRAWAEFREMPGMALTSAQAARLWGVEGPVAEAVLSALLEDGAVRRGRDGRYRLARES